LKTVIKYSTVAYSTLQTQSHGPGCSFVPPPKKKNKLWLATGLLQFPIVSRHVARSSSQTGVLPLGAMKNAFAFEI